MGLIRGALVTILGIVLLVSLFALNATLTLTWSLEYETLKPVLRETIGDLAEEEFGLDEYLDEATTLMQEYCEEEEEFVFSEGGMTFVIPCETVNQGSDAILDQGIDSLMEGIYYAEYDCEFWECVKTTDNFMVLISDKAHDYWQSKFFIFLLASLGLFILMFLVSNKKSNVFVLTGILAVLSSLPFMKLTWVARFVPEGLKPIFLSFFARSYNVFLIMFIVGLVLVGLGITFHFLKWGLKISKLFKKDGEGEDVSKDDVKKIVKKEIAKDKVKQVVEKEIAKTKKPVIKPKQVVAASKKTLGSSASEKGSERKKPIAKKYYVPTKKLMSVKKPAMKSNKK